MRIVLVGVAALHAMVVRVLDSYITRMELWYALPDGGERLMPFLSDIF